MIKKFDFEVPKLTKVIKMPRNIQDGVQPFALASPRDYYQKMYFEVLDIVINCFDYRFSKAAMSHFKEIETLILAKLQLRSRVL